MRIHLPRAGRSTFLVLGGAILGALFAGGGPQVVSALDRPACAETLMRAVSTDQTVNGSYGCFNRPLQGGLLTIGVDSDAAFAKKVGQDGQYHFLRKTEDGGYVYEYDHPTTPHDQLQGIVSALGLPQMRSDVRRGNLLAAWNEKHDLHLAWAEGTGATQNNESRLFTIYLGADGKITAVR